MKIDGSAGYIGDLVSSSKNIAIVCHNRGGDSVAAGIALSSFIEDRWNKDSKIIYSGDLEKIPLDLLDMRIINTSFDPKELQITLDYDGTDIEAVKYEKTKDSKLLLRISPVGSDFDMKRVKYNLSGNEIDLFIVLGAHKLSAIGDLYTNHKKEFSRAKIINIDDSSENENFGNINIVAPEAKSLSEIVFIKFGEWGYVPKRDATKSLLLGLTA